MKVITPAILMGKLRPSIEVTRRIVDVCSVE